jgi:hypothetical protein
VLLFAGLCLSGCAYSPFARLTGDSLREAIRGLPDVPLTREQINDLPYATLAAKVGKGPRSLLVLGSYEGEDLHWVSADRGVLVTRRGRVMKTVGFSQNLWHTETLGEDPVGRQDIPWHEGISSKRLLDIVPENYFSIPVHSTFQGVGEETIEILSLRFPTLVIREQCTAPLLKWRFENQYWADRNSGFIWRSRQHFVPALPPVFMEILKPAA